MKDMGLKQQKCQEKGVLPYRKNQREALNSFSTEAFFSQHLSKRIYWPAGWLAWEFRESLKLNK